MPPKPKGDRAMTSTERVHAFRERQRKANPPLTDLQKLIRARQEIERLRQTAAKAAPALSKALAEARKEITRLTVELAAAATAKPAKAESAPTWEELLMEQRENSRLQKRVQDLEKTLAAKPKAEKAPLPPDEVYERRIKALRTEVRNLKAERAATNQLTAEAIALAGGMSRETRNAIDKVLHPDSRATEADRDKACKGWNVWKNDNDKARRRRA